MSNKIPKKKRRIDDQVVLDRHNIDLDEVREFFRIGGPDEWRESASCRTMETNIFFPGMGEPTGPAQSVCRKCPVSKICLLEALRTKESFGVWGGASERERRRLRQALGRHDIHPTAPAAQSLELVVQRLREVAEEARNNGEIDPPIFREPRSSGKSQIAHRIG